LHCTASQSHFDLLCFSPASMADQKLSLPVRKNLRDNEGKMKEFMEKINEATGQTWVFEVDIPKLVNDPKLSKDYAERVGEILYSSYLEYIANCIATNCEDAMTKEGLIASVSANKLMFRLNPATKGYNDFVIENGVLIMQCKPENFWCNIYDIANFKLDKLLDHDKEAMPLVVRKNLRDNEEKLKERLANIASTVGKEWAFEVDLKAILANKNVSADYKDRLGEILYDSYMERIEQCIKSNCEDDMTKEALVDAISKNKIIYRHNEKSKSYHDWLIEDGSLVLQCKASNMWVNLSDVGYAKLDGLL